VSARKRPKRVYAPAPEAQVDLDHGSLPLVPGPRIQTCGGRRAYIWVGGASHCLGYLDDSRKIRELRDMCNAVLRSRGAKLQQTEGRR
jgi:hypothetical protein